MSKTPHPFVLPALDRRQVIRGSVAMAAAAGTVAAAWPSSRAAGSLRAWSAASTWGGRLPSRRSVVRVDFPLLVDQDVEVAGLEVGPHGSVVFAPDRSVTLTSTGNVVVRGRLEMRPARARRNHVLRFTGVDESAFVGGGMEPLDSDVGLWVMDHGVLDLQGTPRAGWNRTGTDPTWRSRDVLLSAPNAPGDYDTYTPHVAGSPVSTVKAPDGSVHPTEVFNLTRNVRIEGTAQGRSHVFIHSQLQQTIRYVAFAHLGPRRPLSKGPANSEVVLGRYPVHFHHCEDGSRGTLVEGCVVTSSSRAFVPHGSHGITMRDCVAHRITDEAYWWDDNHETHDITFDHCAAFDVRHDPSGMGTIGAFQLGVGRNTTVRDSVAVGLHAHRSSGGFLWPSFANQEPHNVWAAEQLVAHNNRSDGIFVWQNDNRPHRVDGFVGYHNGSNGIHHGAYTNAYAYQGVKVWGNEDSDIGHQALSTLNRASQSWDDVLCEHLSLGHHNRKHSPETTHPVVFRNLRCRRVTVNEPDGVGSGSGHYVLRCAPGWDLSPADVTVVSRRSRITIVRSDGRSVQV